MFSPQRTGVPSAREPEVLSTMATIVNKLESHITQQVPKIFDAVFQCTLAMINKDFEEFPEHRTNFFLLLQVRKLITTLGRHFTMVVHFIYWWSIAGREQLLVVLLQNYIVEDLCKKLAALRFGQVFWWTLDVVSSNMVINSFGEGEWLSANFLFFQTSHNDLSLYRLSTPTVSRHCSTYLQLSLSWCWILSSGHSNTPWEMWQTLDYRFSTNCYKTFLLMSMRPAASTRHTTQTFYSTYSQLLRIHHIQLVSVRLEKWA